MNTIPVTPPDFVDLGPVVKFTQLVVHDGHLLGLDALGYVYDLLPTRDVADRVQSVILTPVTVEFRKKQ